MKLNLQHFDDPTYTLTLYKDSGVTSVTGSKTSGLAQNEECTLTITLETGYELDNVEVIAGGATYNATTKNVKMGQANAAVMVHSKKNNVYKVTESVTVNVNGSKTNLNRNMKLVEGASGAIVDVDCAGTEVTVSADVIASLVAQGILIKM